MNSGLLAYNPAVAATSDAQRDATGAGGGAISGAGNFYSLPHKMGATQKPRWVSEIYDIISTAGPLAGTLTIEVSNDDEEAVRRDAAKWTPFTPATAIPAISGTMRFGISNLIPYGWYRTKFVRSAGTGSIESRRRILEA